VGQGLAARARDIQRLFHHQQRWRPRSINPGNHISGEEIEFRETVVQSDVIRAARLNNVNIHGGTHSFNPESAFLLLLRADSVETGTVITVELTFELAGTLEIQVPIFDRRAIGQN
jgi:hypothetical protein